MPRLTGDQITARHTHCTRPGDALKAYERSPGYKVLYNEHTGLPTGYVRWPSGKVRQIQVHCSHPEDDCCVMYPDSEQINQINRRLNNLPPEDAADERAADTAASVAEVVKPAPQEAAPKPKPPTTKRPEVSEPKVVAPVPAPSPKPAAVEDVQPEPEPSSELDDLERQVAELLGRNI
jgi:hypothetical protein